MRCCLFNVQLQNDNILITCAFGCLQEKALYKLYKLFVIIEMKRWFSLFPANRIIRS